MKYRRGLRSSTSRSPSWRTRWRRTSRWRRRLRRLWARRRCQCWRCPRTRPSWTLVSVRPVRVSRGASPCWVTPQRRWAQPLTGATSWPRDVLIVGGAEGEEGGRPQPAAGAAQHRHHQEGQRQRQEVQLGQEEDHEEEGEQAGDHIDGQHRGGGGGEGGGRGWRGDQLHVRSPGTHSDRLTVTSNIACCGLARLLSL